MIRTISIALSVLVLIVMAPAGPAFANGAGLVSSQSALSLWGELDYIQNGSAPGTAVQGITEQDYNNIYGQQETTPAPESTGRFIFLLHPYGVLFTTPYDPIAGIDGHPVPYDAAALYDTLPPMLQIGQTLEMEDWLEVRLLLDLTPGVRFMSGSNYFAPWRLNTLVMEFPRESYISIARPRASLTLGRFKSGIGFGYFGNTFLNGKAPFYDQIQGSYRNGQFRFFFMLGSSQSFLTQREAEVQAINWDTINNHDGSVFDDPVKLFAYHLLEYHPVSRLTIGLGEMNMVGGKFPDFDQINPVGFWHNTYSPGCSNVMAMGSISIVPFKGLHLFGEFTVDDFRLSTEDALSKPNAFAYQAGARYVLPFSKEVKHVIGVEFTHVDPWTYNRWQPYLTMYQRIMKTGPVYMDVPLGYLYGGDLNHYGIYYMAVSQSGFMAEAAVHRLDKGEVDLGLDSEGNPYYEHYDDAPGPTGVVEHRQSVDLGLTCPLSEGFTLSIAGSYTWVSNFAHVPGATATLGLLRAGLQWSF